MSSRRLLFALAASTLLLPPGLPSAAEPLLLEEINIRGDQQSSIEESLTMREVRESPARDIGEALQQLGGINIVRKGAIANDIVLRGFQRDNINVTIDDIRIHGACPARMDPPSFHFDFAEVESVEVIKGPYDITSPGGIGGSVKAISKRPAPGFGSDLNLTYGSFDMTNLSATAAYGNDAYDVLAGYAYKYSLSPRSGDGKRQTEVANYRPEAIDSRAYEMNTGWLKLGVNSGAHLRSELAYTYQDADHVLYPYLKMDADYDRTHRLNWNLKGQDLSGRVKEVAFKTYWDKVNHVMDDRLRTSSLARPKYYSMQTDAKTETAGADLSAKIADGPGMVKTVIDLYRRNWDAVNERAMYTMMTPYTPVNMIPDVDIVNVGLYAGYDWPLAKTVTLKGGVRGDVTTVKAGTANGLTSSRGDDRDFSALGGNLQLQWQPSDPLEIFVGIARGVRIPDPEELYIHLPGAIAWSGDPDLDPTVNHQLDLGVKYATGRWFASASLFYSRLSNYINFTQLNPTTKGYENVDATIYGSELSGQVALPADLFLRAAYSCSWGDNRDSNEPLSEMPPRKGLLALRYDNGTWFVEAAENLAARQDRVDPALLEEETPAWATTDLKAGATLGQWSLYGGINNLFDRQYTTHLSYQRDPFALGSKVPEPGRNLYLTLAWSY